MRYTRHIPGYDGYKKRDLERTIGIGVGAYLGQTDEAGRRIRWTTR